MNPMTTTPTASEPLRECPFCGSTSHLKSYENRDGARIQCDCGAQGPIPDCQVMGTNHEAIAAWNRRSSPPVASGETPVSVASRDLHRILGLEAERNAALAKVTALEAALRPVMEAHDAKARRCNFTICGCDYCDAARALLTNQEGAR